MRFSTTVITFRLRLSCNLQPHERLGMAVQSQPKGNETMKAIILRLLWRCFVIYFKVVDTNTRRTVFEIYTLDSTHSKSKSVE